MVITEMQTSVTETACNRVNTARLERFITYASA
jgi:hypothetical protein